MSVNYIVLSHGVCKNVGEALELDEREFKPTVFSIYSKSMFNLRHVIENDPVKFTGPSLFVYYFPYDPFKLNQNVYLHTQTMSLSL